jgi:ComF family protein
MVGSGIGERRLDIRAAFLFAAPFAILVFIKMLRSAFDSLVSVIYPQECRVCGDSVEEFAYGCACGECWKKVRTPGRNDVVCEKCGAYSIITGGPVTVSCRQCGDHSYDKAIAAGAYEFALAATVLSIKSRPYLPQHSKPLIVNAFLRLDPKDIAMIVPVPLSERRLHERGYNQAEVIGGFLSHKTGIPMNAGVLVRKVHTPVHRAAMDQKAREITVKNAFEAADKTDLPGASVLLVDDVFTSGATVSNCARILKKNGASRVDVLTLARAV